jgi:hypothetical protein
LGSLKWLSRADNPIRIKIACSEELMTRLNAIT